MKYDMEKQLKKIKNANHLFSSSVTNSTYSYNHILNQTGTPRNDRSIICKRPSQLYQNQTHLISPKVHLRCIKSTDKPLYSSLSIHNNNNENFNLNADQNHSHKEIFCFENDVQQLNIASEENEQFYPLEPLTFDSNKGIEKNSIVSDSTITSPIQIKKILIENYRNEKIKECSLPNENVNGNTNSDNNKAGNQGTQQHLFSVVNKSSQNFDDNIININSNKDNNNNNRNSNNNNNDNRNNITNTNPGNENSNIRICSGKKERQEYLINQSNFFFNIPSINIIYKSQDEKQREKSFAPNHNNYSNFEKIKKPTNNTNQAKNNNHHHKGNSSKQANYQKCIKSFIERSGTNGHHNKWDTLSSRIKSINTSKPKDTNYFTTGIKKSVKSNYPIVSEINKKLFNEINTTFNKKYTNKQSNSNNNKNNIHNAQDYNNSHQHLKHLKSLGSFKRKEYLNIVENLDGNYSKIIQIIDKISVDPLSSTMKNKGSFANKEIDNSNNNSNNNTMKDTSASTIKKLSLTTIEKNLSSSTLKKYYPTTKEININYIKTDLFTFNQYENQSKASFTKSKQPNYSVLSLNILSNWGSKTKVGVTELQLFDSQGKKIPVCECHVFNGSEDNINRIINKKTHTLNDNDMWSTALVPNIKIEVYFDSSLYDVALINIWNYNGKDLQRGIKEIEVSRKNIICWRGIVPRGCFNIKTDYSLKIKLAFPSNSSSNNPNNNTKIGENKCLNENMPKEINDSSNIISNTNDCNNNNNIRSPSKTISQQQIKSCNLDIAFNNNGSSSSARNRAYNNNIYNNQTEDDYSKLSIPSIKLSFQDFNSQKFITFSKIRIMFKESYGNKNYIGLTGIKFVDKNGDIYSVDSAISVGALPKDISSEYNVDDPQIFENVFNNINITNDISNMWLTVFNNPYIEICYETHQTLSQLLIWNYNYPESLDKCAKVIEITFDDNTLTSAEVLLMKGTGLNKGDYSQAIYFPFNSPSYENMINPLNESLLFYENEYVSPLMPSGFWFKFVLLSNHGDDNYIGLNAIEFFDIDKKLIIPLKIINDREMKLIQGNYSDINEYWITSYCSMNRIDNMNDESVFTVIFDKIVSVAYIKIYNIVKELKQGVKTFQIFCDDKIIFEGEMNKTKDKNINENYIVFVDNDTINKELKVENIIGSQLKKEKSKSNTNSNNNQYQIRKTKQGYAMTLKGYN